MIAIKTTLKDDLKIIADIVLSGEQVLIPQSKDNNLVILTEKEYDELDRLRKVSTGERTLKDILLDTQREAQNNGTSDFTMDDINQIIAEVRIGATDKDIQQ